MKASYDFSKGKRGPVIKPDLASTGKVKITIRLDRDVVDYFLAKADASEGKVGYQTIINETLRRSIDAPSLEALIRRAVREELRSNPDAA